MGDLLVSVDSNDVHFRLVRQPSPPAFAAESADITYTVGGRTREGPGSVSADLCRVTAAMVYDDPLQPREMRSMDRGTAGKLIGAERLGTLAGSSVEGDWSAAGAYIGSAFR